MVAYVAQLVAQHPGELIAIEDAQNARRHRDDRVIGVAPSGERIGRRVVDDRHARLGQTRVGRQLLNELMQLGRLFGSHFVRTSHAQRDVTRPPVGAQIHDDRKAEEEQHAALAAEEAANEDQQRRKRREQCCGFECVGHRFFV